MNYLRVSKKQVIEIYEGLSKYFNHYKNEDEVAVRISKAWKDYIKKNERIVRIEIIGEKTRVCIFVGEETLTDGKVGQYKDFDYFEFRKAFSLLAKVDNDFKGYKIYF